MKIKREEILHLADLSNIALSDEEVDSLQNDLNGIIGYISQLDELDTAKIEPTYQVFEMENVWRGDEMVEQDASREQLILLSKKSRENQVEVPKVL